MLNPVQFDKIKHKQQPSMQDVAVLIVTVEQLFRRNEIQASELNSLRQRLLWYRQMTSLREVSSGNSDVQIVGTDTSSRPR